MAIFSRKKIETNTPTLPAVRQFGIDSVILRPVVTEKSSILASKSCYVFVVKKNANRLQVARAVNLMYKVDPISVNIQNVRGKEVRRGRIVGVRKGWKKAMVTLAKGKTLNLYEGV